MSVSIATITGKNIVVDSSRDNVAIRIFERDGGGKKDSVMLDVEAASVLIETLKVYTAKAKKNGRR